MSGLPTYLSMLLVQHTISCTQRQQDGDPLRPTNTYRTIKPYCCVNISCYSFHKKPELRALCSSQHTIASMKVNLAWFM
jgi:hypothetical protein